MFLSDFSIKRPVAMIVIIIALMAFGLLALKKLKVNQIPDVEQPLLVVNVPYPGASPETVEREIINRIEKSLQSISGVDRLTSTASEGNASILIFFNFHRNYHIFLAKCINLIFQLLCFKIPDFDNRS